MGFLRRRQLRIPAKGIEALLIRGHASIRVHVHQLRLRKPGEKYAGPPPVFFKILIVQHAAVCVPPGFYPFVSFFLHIGQLTHIHGSVIVRGVRAVLIIAVGVDRSQTGFHVPDTHPDVCRLSNILRKVREGGGCFALGYRQDIRLRQYGSFYLCSVRFCPGSCQFRAVNRRGHNRVSAACVQFHLDTQIIQSVPGHGYIFRQQLIAGRGGINQVVRHIAGQIDCGRYFLGILCLCTASGLHRGLRNHLIDQSAGVCHGHVHGLCGMLRIQCDGSHTLYGNLHLPSRIILVSFLIVQAVFIGMLVFILFG